MHVRLTVEYTGIYTNKLSAKKLYTVNGGDIWITFDGDNRKADCFYN